MNSQLLPITTKVPHLNSTLTKMNTIGPIEQKTILKTWFVLQLIVGVILTQHRFILITRSLKSTYDQLENITISLSILREGKSWIYCL